MPHYHKWAAPQPATCRPMIHRFRPSPRAASGFGKADTIHSRLFPSRQVWPTAIIWPVQSWQSFFCVYSMIVYSCELFAVNHQISIMFVNNYIMTDSHDKFKTFHLYIFCFYINSNHYIILRTAVPNVYHMFPSCDAIVGTSTDDQTAMNLKQIKPKITL